MKLTLIGMSNVGKSYWSEKLVKKGFKRFCCDDLIEKKLEPHLIEQGFSGIQDVSKWMGLPYEKQYPINSEFYLDCEVQVMKEILEYIDKSDKDIVIDTTGSVIHTNTTILQQIKLLTKVIYLKSPYSVIQEMLSKFIENPKPVFWANMFHKESGEDNMQAIKKCYPKLISYRGMQYNRFADIILDYYKLKDSEFSVEDFLDAAK